MGEIKESPHLNPEQCEKICKIVWSYGYKYLL